MSSFSFDDPEWPVFAALVWIATRDENEVEDSCNKINGNGSGPALDLIISVREIAGERIEFGDARRVQNEFLHHFKNAKWAVTGRRAEKPREELPTDQKQDLVWQGIDHELVLGLESDGAVAWHDLRCDRKAILGSWPAPENSSFGHLFSAAPHGYLSLSDAVERTKAKAFGEQYCFPATAHSSTQSDRSDQQIEVLHPACDSSDEIQFIQDAARSILLYQLQAGSLTGFHGSALSTLPTYLWQAGVGERILREGIYEDQLVFIELDRFRKRLESLDAIYENKNGKRLFTYTFGSKAKATKNLNSVPVNCLTSAELYQRMRNDNKLTLAALERLEKADPGKFHSDLGALLENEQGISARFGNGWKAEIPAEDYMASRAVCRLILEAIEAKTLLPLTLSPNGERLKADASFLLNEIDADDAIICGVKDYDGSVLFFEEGPCEAWLRDLPLPADGTKERSKIRTDAAIRALNALWPNGLPQTCSTEAVISPVQEWVKSHPEQAGTPQPPSESTVRNAFKYLKSSKR